MQVIEQKISRNTNKSSKAQKLQEWRVDPHYKLEKFIG